MSAGGRILRLGQLDRNGRFREGFRMPAKGWNPLNAAVQARRREGRLWGIFSHTPCRQPPAAERRKRPSVAALIVLVENNMVARDIHGMIALRDGSEEVRK
jgi:hypothetical protein